MIKKLLCLSTLLLLLVSAFGEEYRVDGIYPTNWWAGMKDPRLQLMLRGTNINENNFSINYPGIKLVKVNKVENRNYVFLDLLITPAAKPGLINIRLTNPNGSGNIPFELKPRRWGKGTSFAQGVTSSDFIYLIMPDRFSNGDRANDKITAMRDLTFSRDSMYYRHGGDLKGVINHLDYLKDLGVTAVWLNPVIENDMVKTSYHGYAFTNHYKIDPRFG